MKTKPSGAERRLTLIAASVGLLAVGAGAGWALGLTQTRVATRTVTTSEVSPAAALEAAGRQRPETEATNASKAAYVARHSAKPTATPHRMRTVATTSGRTPIAATPTATKSQSHRSRALKRQVLFASGTGDRQFGTVVIDQSELLQWASNSGRFELRFDGDQLVVDSTAGAGRLLIPAGTYHKVNVRTSGHWTLALS